MSITASSISDLAIVFEELVKGLTNAAQARPVEASTSQGDHSPIISFATTVGKDEFIQSANKHLELSEKFAFLRANGSLVSYDSLERLLADVDLQVSDLGNIGLVEFGYPTVPSLGLALVVEL